MIQAYTRALLFLAIAIALLGCTQKPSDSVVDKVVARQVTTIMEVTQLKDHYLYWDMSTWGDSGGPKNLSDAKESAAALCTSLNAAAVKPDFTYVKANYDDSTKRWGMLEKSNLNDEIFLAAAKNGWGTVGFHSVRNMSGAFEAICKVQLNDQKMLTAPFFMDRERASDGDRRVVARDGVYWNPQRPKSIKYQLSDIGGSGTGQYIYVDYTAEMECSGKTILQVLKNAGAFSPCGPALSGRITLLYDPADKSWTKGSK
jgi:hypothetical protein